jgi:hypothetical protein
VLQAGATTTALTCEPSLCKHIKMLLTVARVLFRVNPEKSGGRPRIDYHVTRYAAYLWLRPPAVCSGGYELEDRRSGCVHPLVGRLEHGDERQDLLRGQVRSLNPPHE